MPKPFVTFKMFGWSMDIEVNYLGTASHPLMQLAYYLGVVALPFTLLAVIVVALVGRLASRRLRNSRHAWILGQYKGFWRYALYGGFAYGTWYVAMDWAELIGYQWMLSVVLWVAIGYGVSLLVKDFWYMFDHNPKKVEGVLNRNSLIEFRRWKDGSPHVFIDGAEIQPECSLRVKDHGASGFEWGYGGPGPSQLALALMLEAGLSDKEALKRYQRFKLEYIVRLGWEGKIWGLDAHQWLKRQRRLRWLGWLRRKERAGDTVLMGKRADQSH